MLGGDRNRNDEFTDPMNSFDPLPNPNYREEERAEDGIVYYVEVYDNQQKTEIWHHNCRRHRENDQPAYIEHATGFESYWFEGEQHRTDGPARIWTDGTKRFWFHGLNISDEIYALGYQDADPEFLRTMIPLIAAGKRT